MCSVSEAGSHLGLIVIENKKKNLQIRTAKDPSGRGALSRSRAHYLFLFLPISLSLSLPLSLSLSLSLALFLSLPLSPSLSLKVDLQFRTAKDPGSRGAGGRLGV